MNIDNIKDRCRTAQMLFSPLSPTLKTVLCEDMPNLLSEVDYLAAERNLWQALAEQRYSYIRSLGSETEQGWDNSQYLNDMLSEANEHIKKITAELEQSRQQEADGLSIRLPVKIGGSIWWNGDLHSDPKELKISSASVNSNGVYEYGTWGGNFTPVYVRLDDFGKTWFLTFEEAKKAKRDHPA